MQPPKEQVKNGRLPLDEARDEDCDEDHLDDDERNALRRELAASVEDVRSGAQLIDTDEVLAELQALR